jgi:hypothetical protein
MRLLRRRRAAEYGPVRARARAIAPRPGRRVRAV